jgi:ABC-type transporter MlaC component
VVSTRFVTKQSQEGVSLVGSYRSQFDKVIRTSSYPELVKRLKDKEAATR